MIPRATALSPARTGSQYCAMMCHFTRMEFLLNETEHKAFPSTDYLYMVFYHDHS